MNISLELKNALYSLAKPLGEEEVVRRKFENSQNAKHHEVMGWVRAVERYDTELAEELRVNNIVTDSMLFNRFNYLNYLLNKKAIEEKDVSLWLRFTFTSLLAKFDEYSSLEMNDFVHKYHEDLDSASKIHFKNSPEDLKQLACKKGCSACCHQYIPAVLPEVLELASKYPEKLQNIETSKLYEMSKFHLQEQGRFSSFAIQACPFLDSKGSCTVYSDRPGMCRSYYAKQTNLYCDPFHPEFEKTQSLVPEEASYCMSAALSLYGEFSLAELLLLLKA